MIKVRNVLVARASGEERASLRRILRGIDWVLCFASTFPRAKAALRSSSFGVVICPAQFGTTTHVPIPHLAVVEGLVETLSHRHIGVVGEEFAVSKDGMEMFGVIERQIARRR
jgi:hypothetical protein